MESTVLYRGKIEFDQQHFTKKQIAQGSWKKTVMVIIPGDDIYLYYAWLLRKKHRVLLNRPLRSPHVSFINDRFEDINNNSGTFEEKEKLWNSVKEKWNHKEVSVMLDLDMRTDTKHWWFNVKENYREELHGIRKELGLSERPYFGLHLSIGYCNEKNIAH